MPNQFAIYDWSLYTLAAGHPVSGSENGSSANHAAGVDHSPFAPTRSGKTFTFNGGASTLIRINDDDADVDDGTIEVGRGRTLARDITISGTTYRAGSNVETAYSMLDARGIEVRVVRINGVGVGFSYPTGQQPVAGDTFTFSDVPHGDPSDSGEHVSASNGHSAMIHFAAGTRIATLSGDRPVETLNTGDYVKTLDAGWHPIRSIGFRTARFAKHPDNEKPIQISAGAFGCDLPRRKLVVSQKQEFIMQRLEDGRLAEVSVPAKALTVLPGVRVMNGKRKMDCFDLALDHHHVVLAEGVYMQGASSGSAKSNGLSVSQPATTRDAMPRDRSGSGAAYAPRARPTLMVREARALLKAGLLFFDRPSMQRNAHLHMLRYAQTGQTTDWHAHRSDAVDISRHLPKIAAIRFE